MRSPEPTLVFAFEVQAQVAPPIEIGQTLRGRRRIVPIVGGSFEGPEIKGRLLPGGTDSQTIHGDGFSELDSRYVLETEAGDLIYVRNRGIRHAPPEVMKRLLAGESVDPSAVYFKTTPTFEASAPHLQWLMQSVFVGVGERQPFSVAIQFWRLA